MLKTCQGLFTDVKGEKIYWWVDEDGDWSAKEIDHEWQYDKNQEEANHQNFSNQTRQWIRCARNL